jgi:hypothetical protein
MTTKNLNDIGDFTDFPIPRRNIETESESESEIDLEIEINVEM